MIWWQEIITSNLGVVYLIYDVTLLVLIWIGLFGSLQELEEMKKRLKEMEEEAAALRDMQAKVEKEMSAVQGEAGVHDFLFNELI